MSYSAIVTEVRYEDPAINSRKFYRAYVMSDDDDIDHRVLFQWGRQGARGQFKVVTAPSRQSAINAANGKIHDKEHKGYGDRSVRELRVVPEDLLAEAGVNENARRQAGAKIAADPFLTLEADTDRLIRLVTGPAQVQAEAITLKRDLDTQLHALRQRLTQAEGSLELAADVLSMKLGV